MKTKMIKEFKCYTLLCDNCGADVNGDSEVSGWDSEEYNYDIAGESDWIEHEDKHYCPDCYSFNDKDEIIINTARTSDVKND